MMYATVHIHSHSYYKTTYTFIWSLLKIKFIALSVAKTFLIL
jgi:hypothetical protein